MSNSFLRKVLAAIVLIIITLLFIAFYGSRIQQHKGIGVFGWIIAFSFYYFYSNYFFSVRKISAQNYLKYMDQFMEIHHYTYVKESLTHFFKKESSASLKYLSDLSDEDLDAKNYVLALHSFSDGNKHKTIQVLEEINKEVDQGFGDFFYMLASSYKNTDDEKSTFYLNKVSAENTLLFKTSLIDELKKRK